MRSLQAIDGSRSRLGLPSLDLVQLYWNDYSSKNYVLVAKHLAELQASRSARLFPLSAACGAAVCGGRGLSR
jgi:hypothetical protein